VRTRKPKAAAAVEASKPDDVYQSSDELPEHLKARYEALLEDYDRQVEKKIEEIQNRMIAESEKIYNEMMVDAMSLSKTVRNQKWEDQLPFIDAIMTTSSNDAAGSGTNRNVALDVAKKADAAQEIQKLKEQIASDVQTAIKVDKAAKSTVKKAAAGGAPRTRGASSSENMVPPPPSSAVRASSRTRKMSVKAAAAAGTPGKVGAMDESVLTSTANTTRTRGRRVLQTPGNISIVAGPPSTFSSMGFPLITPKVDLRTPMPRTAMRNPKPNETLVSLSGSPVSAMRNPKPNETLYSSSGSPVYVAGATARRGKGGRGKAAATAPLPPPSKTATIPIGRDQDLQLNVDDLGEDDGDDDNDLPMLDDDAIAKVKAVHNKLGKLLANRLK